MGKNSNLGVKQRAWMAFCGSFLCLIGVMGASTGSIVMCLGPMAEFLGVDHGQTGMIFTFVTGGGAVFNSLAGRIYAKLNIHYTVVLGSIAGCIALLIIANATALWMMYAGGFLFGLCMTCSGTVMAQTIVPKWFFTGRATLTAGVGVAEPIGTTIMSFLAASFASSEGGGFKEVMTINAFIILIVGSLSGLFLMRGTPENYGFAALGAENDADLAVNDKGEAPGISANEAMRSMKFWMYMLGCFCLMIGYYLINPQMSTYSQSIGYTAAEAAILVSTASWAKSLTKFVYGAIADKFGLRWGLILCAIVFVAGVAMLFVNAGFTGMIIVALGVGIAGSLCGSHSLVVAKMFGAKDFLKLSPLPHAANGVGGIVAPIMFSVIYGATGNYLSAFGLALAFAVVYLVVLFIYVRPSQFFEKEVIKKKDQTAKVQGY